MIIGEIKRYLRDNNCVRVSRSMRDLAYRALRAKEDVSRREGREMTDAQTAQYLNENGVSCTGEQVSQALEAIIEPISLYDPVYGDSSDSLFVMDQLRDEGENEDVWLESITLKEAIKSLSQRERSILTMRFFSGKTQMEIANEIGISQAQVSRLEKGAIDRIRKKI